MRRADPVSSGGRRWPSAPLLAGAVWLAAYVLICVTGQRFDTSYLDYGWQLVPRQILTADPLGSVWSLHIQPPLWNLVLGVILRWSPLPDALSLQLLQAALGVALAALLAATARRVGASRSVAVVVALAASLHPDTAANAFVPNYELVVAVMIVALLWVLCAPSRSPRWLVGVAALGTALCMTRSVYHPLFVVVLIALVGWWAWPRSAQPRSAWRRVLAALCVPVVIAGGWMVKNEVLVGRATMSSWAGMNLQRAVIPILPAQRLAALRAAGRVSEIATIGPFGNYELYRAVMPPCVPRRAHPALTELDRPVPPGSPAGLIIPNFNAECFLPVFDQAGRDAWAAIRAEPGSFLRGRAWAARVWFSTNATPQHSPSIVLRAMTRVADVLGVEVPGTISTVDWGQPIYGRLAVTGDFSLTILAATMIVVGAWLWAVANVLRRRWRRPFSVRQLAVLVAGLFVVFTFLVGITFEIGEQARFRTMIDPLVLAGAALLVARVWPRRWRRGPSSFSAPRRRRRAAEPGAPCPPG